MVTFVLFAVCCPVSAVRRPPGPPLPRPILPRDRSLLDRLMEYLVGDGPQNRFALICVECRSHNGMALREEFEYVGKLLDRGLCIEFCMRMKPCVLLGICGISPPCRLPSVIRGAYFRAVPIHKFLSWRWETVYQHRRHLLQMHMNYMRFMWRAAPIAPSSLVGGVAQWLGRRSVAGGLSLIYA